MLLRRTGGWILNVLLLLLALLVISPFIWLVSNALTPDTSAFSLPPNWIPTTVDLNNFQQVFVMIPFFTEFLNSLEIASIVTVGALTTSVLAAYAFARLKFPGRDIIFIVLLSALMIPQQVTVIPLFILMRNLHLLDTHASVILPGLISVLAVFLLRQYFLGIPNDLSDAARIDGASHLRILIQIILPLSAPAIAAMGIYIFQLYWNDFFWPNVFLNTPDQMTLPVGLVDLQGLYGGTPTVVVFAAIAMVVVPVFIVFLFAQRQLTESIAMTGIKG
jgi:multiple sugar transport system permease protein